MSVKGLVFSSRDYIGSVQPPATVLEDTSRFGNDGTFLADGEPNWVRNQRGLWVMDFDGANDRVSFGNLGIGTNGPGTIEAWFNVDILATVRGVDNGLHSLLYSHASNNNWYFLDWTGQSYSSRVLVVGIWSHVVLTWDGNSSTAHLYVNGMIETGTGTESVDALTAFTIGYTTGRNVYFDGKIGKLRVYNYARLSEQIAARFQADKHWFGK